MCRQAGPPQNPECGGAALGPYCTPRDPLQCLPFLWMNQRPQEGTGAWKQCSAEVGSQGPRGSLPQFPLLERETPWQLGGSGGGTESGSTGLSGRTPAAEVVLEPQTSLGNSSAFTVGAQPLLQGEPRLQPGSQRGAQAEAAQSQGPLGPAASLAGLWGRGSGQPLGQVGAGQE